MSLRILSIFGTRPEAIKMAPVVQLLNRTSNVESHVCVTAQHRQMLDQVLDLFNIHPDIDLDLMRPDQSLAEMTAAVFSHLDPVLSDLKPDWILVQGDTTTVMAAALLAYYHHIRIGHVEAGLRTNDKWHPFPEEINRRVASVVADLHFAPTEHSRDNLLREGVHEKRILVTGNPVIDALQYVAGQPASPDAVRLLQELDIGSQKHLVLVTAHRRENFGQPLENICSALKTLAKRNDVEIVYPVHLNPNIQEPVNRFLKGVTHINLLPPLEYLTLIHLMKRSTLILTDSGGIQEEAPAFGVPVLVMRAVTERPEGVEAGTLKLVGTDCEMIVSQASHLLDDSHAYAAMSRAVNPFGDGHASSRIVQALIDYEG